jgi:uncharacterized membrane protein YhhN
VTSAFQVLCEAVGIRLLGLFQPIPIILMIAYISGKSHQRGYLIMRATLTGLVFSLIGDLCLMVNESSSLIVGTMLALVARVFYCLGFCLGERVRPTGSFNRGLRVGISLAVVGVCLECVYRLFDLMPNRVLFSTYTLVICAMILLALNRYEFTSSSSYKFIFSGSIFLGFSSNWLYFLRLFQINTRLGRVFGMLLYYGGQYLIMHGTVHHANLQHEVNRYYKNGGNNNMVPVMTVGREIVQKKQWDHGNG